VPESNAAVPPLPDALAPHEAALVEGPTRHGRMTWFRHDDPVGVALASYGQWAQAELDLLCAFLRQGDTVVDVGSYVGTHALAFAAAVAPSGLVVACEPQPVVIDVLRRNAEEAPARVDVRNVAVGAEVGSLSVPVPAVEGHGNFGALALADGHGPADAASHQTVQVVTVDGLSLPELRLLKIDVEGMEEQVLLGASRTLAELRPVVYAECNTLAAGCGVFVRLQQSGYDVYLHRAPAFDPGNVAGEMRNLFGVACESNLLAIPGHLAQETAATVAARQDLVALGDLDDLAVELLRTPRYGDVTSYDRDPETLRHRLAEVSAAHAEAVDAVGKAQAEAALNGDEAQRQRGLADSALGRAAAAERERDSARSDLAEAQAELASTRSGLREAQTELVRARARLAAVESSTAWRMTAPVRAVGDARRAVLTHPLGRAVRLVVLLLTGRLRDDLRQRRHSTLVRESGLFDDEFYVAHNPDVPLDLALEHYMRHGAAEGRRPNALFDGHWYAAAYPDVASTTVNPLVHYLLAGAREGRDPGPRFSTSYYLASNPDVLAAGTNPLAHYLTNGREEGRSATPPGRETDQDGTPAPRPEAPSDEDWSAVEARTAQPGSPVVVVPVYKGYGETLRCLYSVLNSSAVTGLRLVVVDDASPEPGLSKALSQLAERGLFELVRNERNLGFVGSVNRGMRLAGDADVVLLNSDTEVYGDWLDRLRATAWAAPMRASVTPLTNSGTIASYPRFARDNADLLELPPEELDALAARELAGRSVEIPTCVGFCVYLRGDCLAAVGLFDEEAFGLGYGEENDFSLRASAAGWHHVLAVDVFVRHYGSTSFGQTASRHQRAGLAVLRTRYPGYERLITEHIAEDPAAGARAALDLARQQRARSGRPAILLVTHALGGGTTQHVADLARRLHDQGVMPLVLRPGADGVTVGLSSPVVGPTPNLWFRWSGLPDRELVAALRALDVRHVHVHHLQGYAEGAARVPDVASALGVPFDVTLHDFMTICPRVDLVDHTRRFCGGPEPAKCRRCIFRNGSPSGRPDAAVWQQAHARFLRRARRVFVPSTDTAVHIRALVPGLPLTVRPHPEAPLAPSTARASVPDGLTHVAVLGAISISKGSEVLLALAEDAERRALPVRFHVFGYTNNDAAFRHLRNLSMSGRYAPADLPDLVAASNSSIALFPAVWPETFSYTLSEAVDLGLYPLCFDIGAVAERIRASGYGAVLPWEFVDRPAAVNDALLALAPLNDERPRRPAASYGSLLGDYYELEFPTLG
jgi:FkbM family methyltransferase